MQDVQKQCPNYQQAGFYLLAALAVGYMSYVLYQSSYYVPDTLVTLLTLSLTALYLVAGLIAFSHPRHAATLVTKAAGLGCVIFVLTLLVMSPLFFVLAILIPGNVFAMLWPYTLIILTTLYARYHNNQTNPSDALPPVQWLTRTETGRGQKVILLVMSSWTILILSAWYWVPE